MADCFASVSTGSRCRVLNVDKCRGEACPFRKSREQLDAERARTYERLSDLSDEEQTRISEKYFGGRMPWEKKTKLERRNREGYPDPTAYEALARITAKY